MRAPDPPVERGNSNSAITGVSIEMADLNAIAESLSSLTVMEAAELAKLLEEEWGVSAAAPAAAAAAPVP